MKKSFILSLVMVVVLIASLATATYAWYTSQVQVNTNEVTVTTAGAGKTIVISSTKVTSKTFTNKTVALTADATAAQVQPMIPSALPTADTTLGTMAFVTASVTSANKAAGVGAGTATYVATVTDNDTSSATQDKNMIFVANPGAQASDYTVKVIIDNDTANKGLRVAIFKLDGTFTSATDEPANASAFKLLGIWAPADETVGYQSSTLENGDTYNAASGIFTGKETKIAISADTTTIVYASNTAAAAGNLAGVAGDVIDNDAFAVVAWFEGANLTNAYQGKTATYQIYFDLA